MAGNPIKRARAEAKAAQIAELQTRLADAQNALPDELLAGIPLAGLAPSAARPKAPAPRLRAVEEPARTHSGAETRRVADQTTASELAMLTTALRPGLRVQVERTKPHWCAGIVEPHGYLVRQGGVAELLSYLREEWGGNTYRLTVLQPNGAIAYESQVSIAAPPRYEQREIYRSSWGGESEPVKPAAPPQPLVRNPEASDTFAMLERVVKIVSSLHEGKSTQLDALRQQNAELISALRDVRQTEHAQPLSAPTKSLAEQLGELLEAHKAVERVGKVFGAQREGSGDSDGDGDDSMVKVATKEAIKHFVGSFMSSSMATKAPTARPPAPAHAPARARENPSFSPQKSPIPMAGSAGQKRAG